MAAETEETTTLALQERSKLQKSLRRFDLLFFTVCAFVGLDTLGLVASNGPQGFTWLIVLAVLFVLPYALLMAEVGSAFTQEGGPYEWTKMAFGRIHGGIAAVLYWVTNPLWVGGSLAFIATEAWNDNIFSVGGAGSVGDYTFKLLFIWFSIGVAIVSLRRGKWIPNAGAFMRLFVMGFFVLTVIIYAIDHGVHGFPVSDLKPTGAIFLGLAPVLLFNYVGFELGNGAAEEMQDPQHDVPIAVVRSAVIGVLLYAIPVFGIILVLPPEAVSGIGGFLDAVATTFSVYGGAKSFLLGVVTIAFIVTLLTSGAVWMIGSDRILAVAAYDGAFPGWFGRFNAKLGTPVRVNTMSGITASIFMIVAVAAFNSGQDSKFAIVLTIAISTTLISYLWIFPAALKLRYTHPHVHRPYHVPGGTTGIWVATALSTIWVFLGSWVAVFPGTLEKVFGIDYNFHDTWGVSRSTYEVLTIGTLGVVFAVALIGYALAGDVRAHAARITLDTDDLPETAAV
jgi:glutamate:GABA antiporter